MKLINQNDYPNTIYITKTSKPDWESGLKTTIQSSGCGICCGIMVALHFGYQMDIQQAIQLSYDYNANTSAGTKYIPYSLGLCEKFNLSYTTTNKKEPLFKCLDENGCAVVNVKGGIFSKIGHYIFIDQRDGNTVRVLDPDYQKEKYVNVDAVKVEYPFIYTDIQTVLKETSQTEEFIFCFQRKM